MRKPLKIIALITGMISIAAAVTLGCIYLGDISEYIKKRIAGKSDYKKYIER